MYRLTQIEDSLLHLVGWAQDYNPAKAINKDLTESESGLMYQDAHPLLTLENIRAIIPEDFLYKYPEYTEFRTYTRGQKVRHAGRVYVALKTVRGLEPDSNVSDFNDDYYMQDYGANAEDKPWAGYDIVNDYLQTLTRSGIRKLLQTFMQTKVIGEETRLLLDRVTFFDGAGRIRNVIDNKKSFVGMEITPVRSMGVTAKIERIGLQVAGATGTIRLYLFHSSRYEPIAYKDVEITQDNGAFVWVNVNDWYLPYMGGRTNAGGSWFIGYDQNALPLGMEAINVSKDWSREPCGTCNIGSVKAWRELTKYLQISPFRVGVDAKWSDNPELFDNGSLIYESTCNYGLNVEVSVGCDLTDFIIEQRSIFATALQRQVAAIALRTMAMNPEARVNRNQTNVSRMEILYELDGNTNGVRPGGLGYELKQAYAALRISTQGIDRICLTCNNHGVRYRTV
jgi:hypothetical protein